MEKNDKKVPNLPPGNTGVPKPAQKGKVKAKANQPIGNPDASKPVPKGKVKAAPKLPVRKCECERVCTSGNCCEELRKLYEKVSRLWIRKLDGVL